ncbi:tyrosine-type recombinase/integrase [Emticicia sp.]|uniref:tyrosine-type recombinase/integrase n=1 Tax=Emticicia sp. TaxID=1930953 RepID=UPI00375061F7
MNTANTFLNKRLEEIERQKVQNSNSYHLHRKWVKIKNKDNTVTIYARITYQNKQTEISTGVRCLPNNFVREPQLEIKGDETQTKILRAFDSKLNQVYADFKVSQKKFTIQDIRNSVIGIEIKNKVPLILGALELFQKHLMVEIEHQNYSNYTLRKHRMWYKRLIEFTTLQYGKKGQLDEITPYAMTSFLSWLKTTRNYQNNSAQYLAGHLSRFMNFCVSHRWIPSNPFLSYKKKFEAKEVKYLTEEEITLLEQAKLHSTGLERVRDTFLFMYELSMNHADILAHSKDNLIKAESGIWYIIKQRTKTAIPQTIPLSERAKGLMSKYENDTICIEKNQFVPVPTNQIMNRYLKQIGDITAIKTLLSTKLARTSKITNGYENGENEERLQMMAGHRKGSPITHNNYINHSPKVLIKRMEKLPKNA